MITVDQVLDYNPDVVPALGNVRFEIMRAFVEEDDLDKLEFEMRIELSATIRAWLAELSDKSLVYEAMTAESVSFNELRWQPGVVADRICDHQVGQWFLRVARSYYTTDPIAQAKHKILGVQRSLTAAQEELSEILRELKYP